jgi:hypothetical protein
LRILVLALISPQETCMPFKELCIILKVELYIVEWCFVETS